MAARVAAITERTFEVDDGVDDVVFVVHGQGALHQPAGVVDQDVDGAEGGDPSPRRPAPPPPTSRCRPEAGSPRHPDCIDVGDDLFGLFAAGIAVDGDLAAAIGEAFGDGGADPGRRAGDQHGLADEILEIILHGMAPHEWFSVLTRILPDGGTARWPPVPEDKTGEREPKPSGSRPELQEEDAYSAGLVGRPCLAMSSR